MPPVPELTLVAGVPPDVAGDVTVRIETSYYLGYGGHFTALAPVVVVRQNLGFVAYAGTQVIPRSLADDPPMVQLIAAELVNRWLRPWARPDRNPLPHIDPFPRTTATARRARHLVRSIRP
jgi:hypothetical protein